MNTSSIAYQPVRYALITGAAGGIGRALVQAFVQAGYKVIATDVQSEPERLCAHHYLQVDLVGTVGDEAYADEVFAQIRAWLPVTGLNVLINNAAIQILGAADGLTRADWCQTLDVNLLAPFFWTQALLPELEAARGGVINVSSIHARLTKKNFVAYATSKAALSGMTRALAVELGARVRVNAIEPAAIETSMLRAGFEDQPQGLIDLKTCHPTGNIGHPAEVARMAVALSDDAMGFMNGSCISIDGGISDRLHDPK